MAKFTKKMQANTIRLIALNRVSLDSYASNGEPMPDATLVNVACLIDSMEYFKRISSKQTNTVKMLPDNKVLITDVSVSPDGMTTSTHEVILNLVSIGSYEFLNCL